MVKLSICIIVKNGEKYIDSLLSSLEQIPGTPYEVIVTDTGSTDNTLHILKKHKCKVFHFDWVDDFSKARNFCQSKATGDYILWLDVDESIAQRDLIRLCDIIKNNNNSIDIYDLSYQNYSNGKKQSDEVKSRVIRRSANLKWIWSIHEILDYQPNTLSAKAIDVAILHDLTYGKPWNDINYYEAIFNKENNSSVQLQYLKYLLLIKDYGKFKNYFKNVSNVHWRFIKFFDEMKKTYAHLLVHPDAKNKRLDLKTGFLCNNNCQFCVQADNKYKGNRSLEDLKKDMEESRKLCDEIVFTGGEVTIRPDIFELVAYAKKMGFRAIQIQSNCRMLANVEFAKKLVDAGATEFSPALHGHTAELHDYLTKSPGSFNQTVKAIMNLKKLGQIVITNTVVVKSNYMHLPEIAKLLVKLNVNQFQFAFVHAMGNAYKNFDSVVPVMSLAAPYIHKGLQIGIDAGIMVMAEAMPYCMMKGYEKYVSEKYIPDVEVKTGISYDPDFKKTRITEGKAKFPQCRKCKYDNICEGPWKEYPEKFGNEEFKAVIDSNILSSNAFGSNVIDLNHAPDSLLKHVELNLGQICNNDCMFCMNVPGGKKDFLEKNKVMEELDALRKNCYNSIGFLGGEPTVYPYIVDVVSYAHSIGFDKIHLVSNGRKLKDMNFASMLVDAGVTRFSISIHSCDEKTEDELTRVKGSFKEKLSGIKNIVELHKQGRIKDTVSINIVINRYNMNSIPQMLAFFSNFGVHNYRFNFIRPEGSAKDHFEEIVPKYSDFAKKIMVIINAAYTLKASITFGDMPYCTISSSSAEIDRMLHLFCEKRDYFDDVLTMPEKQNETSRITSWNSLRKDILKEKPVFCKECKFNNLCEGPWREYLRRYGEGEFKAVIQDEN